MKSILRQIVPKAAFLSAFGVMCTVIVLIVPIPPSSKAAAPAVPHCAMLEAQQMASPGVAVPGSFACLSGAVALGFSSDDDLAALAAQPPTYTSYRYVGHTAAGYYFQMSPGAGCFRFHIDSDGKIDRAAFGDSACPSRLP